MEYLKKFFQFFVLCVIFGFSSVSAEAASLKFDPNSISASKNGTFDVKINVEVGSEQSTSVDVFISYDASVFDLGTTPVTTGGFFPSIANVTNQPGKLYIAGLVTEAGQYRTGTGTLATITFKPKTTGTSTLSFDCSPGVSGDSNIVKNDTNSTDIINCSDNNTAKVEIGEGSSSSSSTSTSTSGPTPTPYGYRPPASNTTGTNGGTNGSNGGSYEGDNRPNSLPRTGTFENVMKFSLPGGIMLLVGGLLLFL
jgi:hypothetical protein